MVPEKAIDDTINGLLSLGKSALDYNTYSSIGKKAIDYGNKLKSSPIATLNSTAHKTIDMAKYMGQTVQNAFERDVIHGDAKSRTEFFTYGLASIGISLLGDKGLSKLGTAAKVAKTGNLAEKAGKLKVNTGFAPALEAAGAGPVKIPYNVMDELGVRIQKATEERWGNSSRKLFKFKRDRDIKHFEKHSKEIMDAMGKSQYNLKNYLNDANHVMKTGQYVPELNGYVKLIGGKGSAKYAFVGIDRITGNITTFHIKSVKELAKKAPSIGIKINK
ncbi:hypothetical protein NSQ19_12985 [Weizmannia sp. FSL W8-1119]